MLEPQRDVGILGGVLLDPLDVHQIHRQLLGAFADQGFDLDRLVVEVFLRKGVHVVARFGIEQVVQDHRIVLAAPDFESQLPQDHQVELDILADLGDPVVFEKRPHDFGVFRRILLLERNVPRFERLHGQRHADDAVVEDVESRRLGVEAELFVFPDFVHHFAQLRGVLHESVVVRRGLRRLELHRFGFGLQFGSGNVRRRRHLHDRVAEEVALTDQRGPFRGRRLGAGHLGQLRLRLLPGTFGQGFGRGEVRQVVHKRLEIQFCENSLEFVDMGIADRKVLRPEGNRHIETNCGQVLGETQFIAPRGDFLALLALDLRHVVEDVLHRSPLLHQFAGALLADARHAGNVVRSVAPQREDVAHKDGIVDAVLLADRIAVHDLDASVRAFLLVNLTVVAHQLAVVLVGRHHEDLVAGFDALLRQGADHVVGLVAFDLQNRNAHRLQHPFHIGNRKQDVFGSLGAVGLVLRKNLAAETAALGVERHAQQVGPFAFLNVAQELDEAEHHRGVHARAVAHRTAQKSIVILEDQRIGVNEKKFFHI